MNINNDSYPIYDVCKQHMHGYVMAELADQSRFDGIVTGLDHEYVYFAVPVEHNRRSASTNSNQMRRFNRLIVSLSELRHLRALPWY